jgi:hypothetical protein
MSISDPGAVTAGKPSGEETPPEPGPSRWATLVNRKMLQRAALGMLAGTAVAVAVPVGWFYPYLRDDRSLDLIVRVVALDWRDFGESRARWRLQYELDHAGIGGWVQDDDCAFVSEQDQRIVRCRWGVEVEVPGANVVLPLSFSSEAHLDSNGELK